MHLPHELDIMHKLSASKHVPASSTKGHDVTVVAMSMHRGAAQTHVMMIPVHCHSHIRAVDSSSRNRENV